MISSRIVFCGLIVVGHVAFAQFISSQQIGDFTFTSGTDANGNPINGSSIRIGDSVFHNFNLGNGQTANGSTVSISDTDFHNIFLSDGSAFNGTSQYLGNFGFHNFFGSNGDTVYGTSIALGDTTTFNSLGMGDFGRHQSFFFDSPQVEVETYQPQQRCNWFNPAEFTFGEAQVRSNPKHQDKDQVPIFDTNPGKTSAAGILVSPSAEAHASIPGLTLDEMYARAATAVRNKHFVMIANVAGIYNNIHQVLLDTCDVIKFPAAEFKKIQDNWKVGDLVTISEWVDDNGNLMDYELEVYGKTSARGEVVDE